jgi:LPXTG-site transpeptidase (sortase) family protein
MGAGVASLIAAAVLLTLTLTGTIDDKGYSGPGTTLGFGNLSDYLTPQATATPAGPPPSEAPIANLVIPKFDINAPVVIRGVDGNGVMQTPDGPVDVAWYEFSKKPGFGGNAVFSGHVDYINYGPAVFWHLKDLEQGDIIEVRLNDGTVYTYSVATKTNVSADPPQEVLDGIVGQTPNDVITLITCGGTFSSATGQYDQRVIVRAELMPGTPQASGG